VKKTEIRTKKKQANEANASEADELIKDFLVRNYIHNKKTERILKDYIDNKTKEPDASSE